MKTSNRMAGLLAPHRTAGLIALLCATATALAEPTQQPHGQTIPAGQNEIHSQPAAPDLVLRGILTGEDNQKWRLVPFEVPEGTTRITVDFDYDTRDQRTVIDLGILGPDGFHGQDGFRGWSGGNKQTFTISATDATPSYLPGAIRPGSWNLMLSIPNIRRDTRAQYTANVRFERADAGGNSNQEFSPVLRNEPGWYRGDLHMHTANSDGSCVSRKGRRVPCPLYFTVKAASDRGLDFIAITDHNTISHANEMRELQPWFDDLLLIPGREITTFTGHGNLIGTVASVDFRVGSPEVPDWNAFLKAAARTGGLFSINHALHPSGEACMGCGWTPAGDVDYSRVASIEVANGTDADGPKSGIPFWEQLLNRGYHLTGVGGSDNHDAFLPLLKSETEGGGASSDSTSAPKRNNAVGTPTTVVYADSLSQGAIVAAIRRGRVFVDVQGSRDRLLDVTATSRQHTVHMGDTLEVRSHESVQFEGAVTGVSDGEIQVILDGQRVPLLSDPSVRSTSQSFTFKWRTDGKPHWMRIDVRDQESHLLLVGNPIYVQSPVH